MKTLLRLQDLDLQIETCKARELEIPRQKGKFEVQKERLAAELNEREELCKGLELEQRGCEGEIAQKQGQVEKYEQQLFSVKKNEEYQALLHEIDGLKKQISAQEERAIALMVELDDARERLEEDRKRIKAELDAIDRQCAAIDAELAEAVAHREVLETDRKPLTQEADPKLFPQYKRIRKSKRSGAAVVPIRGESCSGCNMIIPAQIVNEILGGKIHSCPHCGRLMYDKTYHEQAESQTGA